MATDCMPAAPAAPDLLVRMTGCLSARSMAAASGRPVRSAWPPGGNGLTIVIGRLGNDSCAMAGAATSNGAIATLARRARLMAPPRAPRISIKMARDQPAALGPQRRLLRRAVGHRERAARVEAAAAPRRERARHLARERHL